MTAASTRRQPQTDPAAALATRAENGAQATNTLADQIRGMEQQFQMAMPKGLEARQLIRDALTVLRTTKGLADCTYPSIMGGLMTCAQLGLRPSVLGQAYLLPFKDRGVLKAQLVIGYQGYIELALRSGQIRSLIARTVYANDQFDVDYGLADTLVHKPELFGDRGAPIAYYAIAKFANGGYAFMVMSKTDVEQHRDRHSKMKSFGPWVDHFDSMAHKTCVRMLAKYMPKSPELAAAVAVDEGIRINAMPDVDAGEATQHPVYDGEIIDQAADAGQSGGDPWDEQEVAQPGGTE